MRCFAKSLRARFFAARLWAVLALSFFSLAGAELPTADGYRGIWYSNQRLTNAYEFVYSGGFATYPQQHIPVARLTRNSRLNHTYARRPLNAHPGFYAVWADGDGRSPAKSTLYFTDQEGTGVWRLPTHMSKLTAKPEQAF